MEQGNNWASWKHSWSRMNLVLCQCSSFPRVGALLACDLLYELFPRPVHSGCCSLHCSPGCPKSSPTHANLSPPLPSSLPTGISPLWRSPSARQVPRAPPALLLVWLPHAHSDWPQGARVVHLGIPAVVWLWWGEHLLACLCRSGLDSASLERLE